MAYDIDKFNGTPLTTVVDGSVNDTATDVKLLGKGSVNYGEIMAENLVWMVENFARDTAPDKPLVGQLWFDSSNGTLKYLKTAPDGWKTIGVVADEDTVDAATGLPDPIPEAGTLFFVSPGTGTGDGVDGAGMEYVSDGTQWLPFMPLWQSSEPTSDNSFDIGTASSTWRNLYAGGTIYASTAEFTGTSAMLIPSGTNAERPSVPTEGMIRYNSEKAIFEAYYNGDWLPIGGAISPDQSTEVDVTDTTNTIRFLTNSNLQWTIDPNGHFVPSGDAVKNIGEPSNRVNDIYVETLHADTINTSAGTVNINNFMVKNDTNLPTVNNTYDLGSSTYRYSTMYATTFNGTATEALYADLAERYKVDSSVEPGDLVKLGGSEEVTKTTKVMDTDVFGVVSTNPAIMMNSNAGDNNSHPYIALSGRVPVKCIGEVKKGQRLVASNIPGVAMAVDNKIASENTLSVFGRSLEDNENNGTKIIEAAVGVK